MLLAYSTEQFNEGDPAVVTLVHHQREVTDHLRLNNNSDSQHKALSALS